MKLLRDYLIICGLLLNAGIVITYLIDRTSSISIIHNGLTYVVQQVLIDHPSLRNISRATMDLLSLSVEGDSRVSHMEKLASSDMDRSSELSISTASADDFLRRCRAPGVVRCIGFDQQSYLLLGQIIAGGPKSIAPSIDKNVFASGSGALHFTMPPGTGANGAGGWLLRISDSSPIKFGTGKPLFVQFRQRFDNNFLKSRFSQGGWKQVIFFQYPSSCAALEITTVNMYWRGFPQMYTHCGAKPLQRSLGNGDYLLQQSPPDSGGYECHYQHPENSHCGWYRPDQWMTFYYEIRIGDWGKPNSIIRAWMAYEGEPLWQFIDYTDHVMTYNTNPGDGIDSILLTPYSTGKKPETNHPVAHTWYDELIVSEQPIPAPTK